MNLYRISFYYTDEDGRLRTKRKLVEAQSFNDAVEKMKEMMGTKIVVLKIQKI